MTPDDFVWTATRRRLPGQMLLQVTVTDRRTGLSLAQVVDDVADPLEFVRVDLEDRLARAVRAYTCLVLASGADGTAPVVFAGGPLDGQARDEPVTGGAVPAQRIWVHTDPFVNRPYWWAPTDAVTVGDELGEPVVLPAREVIVDGPPHRWHIYERGPHPRLDVTEDEEHIAWVYRHVGTGR
ncbi:hypothetical protein [Dactylosporangium sp. CS-033363]|uniref:hypothetical protein n=1 Tax=Dactylosporangium sp. CS-033363 TaxID=3239935 RepID=UPI003D925B64